MKKVLFEIIDDSIGVEDLTDCSRLLKKLERAVKSSHFSLRDEYLTEVELMIKEIDDYNFFHGEEEPYAEKIAKRIKKLALRVYEQNKPIFLVHGRSHIMRDKLSAFLGKLHLEYSILESEVNNGATLIEKLVTTAEDSGYAIILLAADDEGRIKSDNEPLRPRARQNVVLELGYFLGQLGRRNVLVMHEFGKEIEKPTDFSGVVYLPMDDFGGWKTALGRELEASGFYLDNELLKKA